MVWSLAPDLQLHHEGAGKGLRAGRGSPGGQIKLGLRLLDRLSNRGQELQGTDISADGIFDTKDFRQGVVKLGKVPVVPYNPRNSRIKKAWELPDDNWRPRVHALPQGQGGVQREVQDEDRLRAGGSPGIKLLALVGRLREKTKRTPHMSGEAVKSQVAIG